MPTETRSINFKCSAEQRRQIEEAANSKHENLTQFCLRVLLAEANNETGTETPGDLTDFLKEQIKEKDDQIRDLRKLLDQEQQLHAMSRNDNQEQKLLIDKLNRPFWQKWFSRES